MIEPTEHPIDLADDRTLKGYGRRQHGLNGKDADLDRGGQNYIKTAWWFADGHIEIEGHRYGAVVPAEDATDEQEHMAQEIVSSCGLPGGEWDGDYWVFGEDYKLSVPFDWDDKLTTEQNIDNACRAAYDAIEADSAAFEREHAALVDRIERVYSGKEQVTTSDVHAILKDPNHPLHAGVIA